MEVSPEVEIPLGNTGTINIGVSSEFGSRVVSSVLVEHVSTKVKLATGNKNFRVGEGSSQLFGPRLKAMYSQGSNGYRLEISETKYEDAMDLKTYLFYANNGDYKMEEEETKITVKGKILYNFQSLSPYLFFLTYLSL